MKKPATLKLREVEWAEVSRFASNPDPPATLALVYGRRRVGKTRLLGDAADAANGLVITLTEQETMPALAAAADAYAGYVGGPTPVFASWRDAFDALLALGRDRPVLVVLDEFQYAVAKTPELPSQLSAALDPTGPGRDSRTRLVLCGSALSTMAHLGDARAPLRGRASLVLDLHPFDVVATGAFVGVRDPYVALLLYAVTGGIPAYLGLMAASDPPTSTADFNRWIVEAPLNPSTALFLEGEVVLGEHADVALRVRNRSLYDSVVTAVAHGAGTVRQMSSQLGRKAADLADALSLLLEARLLERVQDPLRSNRPVYAADPFVRFHRNVVAPYADRLWTRRLSPNQVWADPTTHARFLTQVLGPTWEEAVRDLVVTSGRVPTTSVVGRTVVADRAAMDIDVVAATGGRNKTIHLLAEVKVDAAAFAASHARRLVDARAHLDRINDAAGSRLALVAATGDWPAAVRAAAHENGVDMLTIHDLWPPV